MVVGSLRDLAPAQDRLMAQLEAAGLTYDTSQATRGVVKLSAPLRDEPATEPESRQSGKRALGQANSREGKSAAWSGC